MLSTISISMAGLLALWASKKASYVKLHFAMALNIIGLVVLTGAFVLLRWTIVPSLTDALEDARMRNNNDEGIRYPRFIELDRESLMETSTFGYIQSTVRTEQRMGEAE